jgi:hypothetical protein
VAGDRRPAAADPEDEPPPAPTADAPGDGPDDHVDASAFADWIDAEPVPALRQYQLELAALAAEGQGETEPVTDRIVQVIAALEDVGEALREEDALPTSLEAVFARCAADIAEAQSLVESSRADLLPDGSDAVLSDAVRERVRQARSDAGRR